uniref:Uncharacterized protein n=1 Tax=Solanum tuberosum TaxID=4113 RepID=M0ZR18_SOLTU
MEGREIRWRPPEIAIFRWSVGESAGRGERDRWERRGKEFDGKGVIFGKRKRMGKGESSGKKKSVADGLYLFWEKMKTWDLIWAVRSFDRTVGKNREFKNK